MRAAPAARRLDSACRSGHLPGRRRAKTLPTKRCSKARGCRPEPSPFSAAGARYTNALRLATPRPESHAQQPPGREGDDPLAAPPGIKTPSAQNPMKKSGDNTRHSPDLRAVRTPSTTGPRTLEGRKASAMNALKHGMTSQTVLLPDEDPGEFEHFASGMRLYWLPFGAQED